MNLLQIIKRARYEADGIRSGGTVSDLWTNEEMTAAANTAVDEAYRVLRLANSNIVSRALASTAAAIDFISESYNPTSLRLVDDTIDYTLPPDFVRIVSIAPRTTGFQDIRFRPIEPYMHGYVSERSIPVAELSSVLDEAVTYWYTVIGARTLRIVPAPQDTIDIELLYHYRPNRLLSYTTGTVTVTNASAAVTGAGGTDWLIFGLRNPAELVVGATTVNLDQHYPDISTIDSATGLTLTRTYQGSTAAGQTYAIAMTPLLPEEHHEWLAQMTAAIMLRKVNLELSKVAREALMAELATAVQPEVTLRQMQESITVDPYDLPG